MYGKIYPTMWEGSLMEQGGRDGVCLFAYMCSAADKNDIVHLSKTVLGQRAGFKKYEPDDWAKFEKCLAILEAPDPDSNIPDENGKRIIPLKDLPEFKGNRGWFIVNRKYYTQKQAQEDKREKDAQRQRRKYWRDKLEKQGMSTQQIEKLIVQWEQLVKDTSRSPHADLTPLTLLDLDVDYIKDKIPPTPLKTCENCKKDFKAAEDWHTKCPSCFKDSKGHRFAALPECPNPKCSVTAPSQRIDFKAKGCNFCKPDKVS